MHLSNYSLNTIYLILLIVLVCIDIWFMWKMSKTVRRRQRLNVNDD